MQCIYIAHGPGGKQPYRFGFAGLDAIQPDIGRPTPDPTCQEVRIMFEWMIPEFDWYRVLSHLRDLVLAYVLAIPIAWDREDRNRTAGLRTFPLVAVAACGYALIGFAVLDSVDAQARIMQGLITGIGFIGGGAILKDGGSVEGTATAASLWATGAIGLAVASHRIEIALLISIATFLTLRFLKPLMDSPSPSED